MTDPGPSSQDSSLGVRTTVCSVAAFAVLAVIVTWPAATQLGTHMIGGDRDGPMFLWNLWWGAHALLSGNNPLATEHLFHPVGTSLVINTHGVLPAMASAPLQKLFGLIPAYDLMILGTYVLSGWGAALLSYEILKDRRAAFVVGCAFAFCHFRSSFVMFLNLIQSQFLVLFAWSLWCTGTRRHLGYGVAAGVFAAALLYSSYNLTVLATLWAIGFALFVVTANLTKRQATPPRPVTHRCVTQWGIAAGVALLLGAPLLWQMVQEIRAHEYYAGMEFSKTYEASTPLRRYLVPGPLSGSAEDGHGPIRQASYLGVVVMGLALLGLVRHWRRGTVWFWAVVALLFLITSLGPVADLTGLESLEGWFPEKLPFAFLREWPLLTEIRVAHRYGLVGAMALAVLAGFGAKSMLGWAARRHPKLGTAGAIVLGLAIVFDFLQLPFPKRFELPAPPDALAKVAEDPRDCAVLEFPGGRPGFKAFSYFETLHQKPVYLDGQIARRVPHLEELQEESSLRAALEEAFVGKKAVEDILTRPRKKAIRQEVEEHRIGWVLLAWTDYRQSEKKGASVTIERLQAMRKVVERSLPIEATVYAATDEEALAWNDLKGAERKSTSCLYRIYKIDFANARTGETKDRVPASRPESGASEEAAVAPEIDEEELLQALEATGYVNWDSTEDREQTGVVHHDPRAAPGYNLYANGEDQVFLMDMDGNQVHRWEFPEDQGISFYELLEDGLLAIGLSQELVLSDFDSEILWRLPVFAHHDMDVAENGDFLVLTRDTQPLNERTVYFDGIARVSPRGKLLSHWSTFDHRDELRDHHEPRILDRPPRANARKKNTEYDYYHANSLEVLAETPLGHADSRFRPGNLLLSMRHTDCVMILDQDSYAVEWSWGVGEIEAPHMPTLLPNGNLLLFDNGSRRGYTRVLELELPSGNIVWAHEGDPRESFFSKYRGSNQRFAGGTTLICESEKGHAFEVTRDGTVVWDFWNPEVVDGQRRLIYRLVRHPPDFIEPLLR